LNVSPTSAASRSSAATRHVDSTPWYRQAWPWALIALPAISVVLGLTTLCIALGGADAVVPHEGDSTSWSAPRGPACVGACDTSTSADPASRAPQTSPDEHGHDSAR